MKTTLIRTAAILAMGTATAAMANVPIVGGAPMPATNNIVENAVQADNLTTLVAAVQAADLVDVLASEGPFTVFAPVNDAFAALPEGTVDTLLKPENKDMLTKILTSHVVAEDLSAETIIARTKHSTDGFYHFNAVSGDALSAQVKGGNVYIYDESGNAAMVTTANVDQANGVVHVINGVLLPK